MIANNKKWPAIVFIAVACTAPVDWETLQPMPVPRSETSAAQIGGEIFVPGGLGGLRTFQSYRIADNSWKNRAPLPMGRHHLMTVAFRDKVFVLGGADSGWNATDTAWVYDANRDHWDILPAMPEPRYAGAAVGLGDYIYLVGGVGPSGRTMRYHPNKRTWKMLAATKQRREHAAAVLIQAKIMVIGGRYTGVGELNTTELYDVDADQWQQGPQLNIARGGHAAVVLGERVIVMGGEVIMRGLKKTLADSEQLDNLSGSWRNAWNLPRPLHGMAAVSQGQTVYLLGGSDLAGAMINRGQVYRLTD